MSKHSKHKHHHHKDHKEPAAAAAKKDEPAESGSAFSLLSDEPEEKGAEAEDGEKGVFRNIAELNGKKSGGHEPVAFIPPNPPQDFSAQASLDAHEAAGEDKDPSEVQQELSHKEILAGALDPSSPDSVTKDLPDAGKNPDAEKAEEAPAAPLDGAAPAAEKENAGQEKKDTAPSALTQPSSDGSSAVDATDPNAPHTDALTGDTDSGATPSAS